MGQTLILNVRSTFLTLIGQYDVVVCSQNGGSSPRNHQLPLGGRAHPEVLGGERLFPGVSQAVQKSDKVKLKIMNI